MKNWRCGETGVKTGKCAFLPRNCIEKRGPGKPQAVEFDWSTQLQNSLSIHRGMIINFKPSRRAFFDWLISKEGAALRSRVGPAWKQ